MKRHVRKRPLSVALMIAAILALALPVSAAAQENILRVGPGQEYATIQAAVMDARQGSRILVYPGVYVERVIILTNNLQIIAQGPGVRVEPAGLGASFYVRADHVTIQGFEIGFGRVEDTCAVGIWFEGSHNTFADNYFFSVGSCQGINALSCRDPDGGSDYNVVERNIIQGPDLGIAIQADTGVNTGNVIQDNTVRQISQTAIAIGNGIGFRVSGNRIEGATGYCILAGPVGSKPVAQGHHTIVENSLDGCGVNGVSIYANAGTVMTHNRIADNTAQHCSGYCIDLKAYEGGTLTDNEIKANSVSDSRAVSAIHLSPGADDNRILDNEVVDAGLIGIRVEGADNLIVGNVAQGSLVFDLEDLGVENLWRNNTYDTANW